MRVSGGKDLLFKTFPFPGLTNQDLSLFKQFPPLGAQWKSENGYLLTAEN